MIMDHHILLLDDEEAILRALKRYLSRAGFHVDCATELEEATALISHRHYQVVITDLRLGNGSGTEGLDLLSFARQRSPETARILLTAYGTTEVMQEAEARGAQLILSKPMSLQSIATSIRELLGGAAGAP